MAVSTILKIMNTKKERKKEKKRTPLTYWTDIPEISSPLALSLKIPRFYVLEVL